MRFSHTADCHLGGHRDPRLRKLADEAFATFVEQSIQDGVDFCLIAGDLFHTALPGIETLSFAVEQLGRLKDAGIPLYAIPGSHDHSPSGRTMLDVLEKAGLLVNVHKGEVVDGKLRLAFTTDRTGVKLTGMLGKRGMLDKQLYEDLDPAIEREPGEKIFLFHTSITELHGKDIASQSVRTLPAGFAYYAGGHVHIVNRYADARYRNVVYPGPLFPNSFAELEELGHGGYWLYDDGELIRKDIKLKRVVPIRWDVDGCTGKEANERLRTDADVEDAIALLRVEGTLREGSPADVDLRAATRALEARGAYVVLRNAAKLTSAEFTPRTAAPAGDVEAALLDAHKEQLAFPGTDGLARELMRVLGREQAEGETAHAYQERVMKDALALLDGIK